MKILALFLVPLLSFIAFADWVVPIDEVEDNVNIRLFPDASSEIVGRLDQGAATELVSSIEGWYEVQLEGGATGYISADWTRVVVDEVVVDEPVVEAVVASVEQVAAEVAEEVAEEVAAEVAEEVAAEVAAEVAEEVVAAPVVEVVAVHSEIVGTKNFVVKFHDVMEGGNSQIYDNGLQVGIGTTQPKQRLEVNGSIQIHDRNSSVAGLVITQSSGDTGYIMHNRASTLTIGAGSQDRITIDRDGNVGFAVSSPDYPLEMASGARVTAGGVWTNSSSRSSKENIQSLSAEQAASTLMALEPVVFNYRNEKGEDYVGFIAEDVPDLVAMSDRAALSSMDIVAVLTRVVQEQQNKIKELEELIESR